jgi:putative chitinase
MTDKTILKLFRGSDRAPLLIPFWLDMLPAAGIDSHERLAAYFAQVSHETGNLRAVEENLNYSAKGLAEIWPKRYAINPNAPTKDPNDLAKAIARNPVAIANHTYANRMGNGGVESGDGYKYRGRGLFQLTGKIQYVEYSKDTYGDNRCVINPDLVAYSEDCVRSSIWYWIRNGLNAFADARDIKGMTKKINGGYTGLEHRQDLYRKFTKLLAE